MKKIALILTVLMILSAGAAFALPGEADAPMLTTYEVVAAADQQLNEAESFEMDLMLVLAMSAEGENVAANIDANMKFILDPLAFAMVFDMAIVPELDEAISAEIYLRTEDGVPVIYAEAQDEVIRMSLEGLEELIAMLSSEMGDLFEAETAPVSPEDYDRMAFMGETTLNGKTVYIIEAEPSIPVKEMQDVFSAMGLDDMYSELGISTSAFISAYEGMTFTYYIDRATHQYVRMEMDLTGIMRNMMASMGLTDEVYVSIDQYSVVIDIKDINKVKPFDVPKRILNNAEDMGDLFGAGDIGVIGGADGPTAVITEEYFDQIDWEALMEADEAALEAYVDADGNIDYAALAEAYPAL